MCSCSVARVHATDGTAWRVSIGGVWLPVYLMLPVGWSLHTVQCGATGTNSDGSRDAPTVRGGAAADSGSRSSPHAASCCSPAECDTDVEFNAGTLGIHVSMGLQSFLCLGLLHCDFYQDTNQPQCVSGDENCTGR